MNRLLNILAWVLQGICTLLLVYSIVMKIMQTDKEKAAFRMLEMEGFGMWASLGVEILCVVGLCTPMLMRQAAVITILVFGAGVFFHLSELGVRFWSDEGERFYQNLAGLICSIGVLLIRNHLTVVLFRRGRLD